MENQNKNPAIKLENETIQPPMTAQENFDLTADRDTRVGVCGDWHGNTAWGMHAIDTLADNGVKTIFHVGDFGFWGDTQGRGYIRKLQRSLSNRSAYIYVTLGNHEDYNYIEKVFKPLENDSRFLFNQDYPNIAIFARGARWNWQGHRWISVGGAHSIDRYFCKPGKTWWKQESISDEDVAKSISQGRADIMIAHDAPIGVDLFGGHRDAVNGWTKEAMDYAVISRVQLRKITDVVQPARYIHGHYHMTKDHSFKFSSAGFSEQQESTANRIPEHERDQVNDEYTTNYICLDKEYTNNNIGFIDLNNLEFSKYSSFG